MLGFFLLFAVSQFYVARRSDSQAAKFPEKPLAGLPLTLDEWRGEEHEVIKNVLVLRTPSDAIHRDYDAPQRPPVAVYVLYWAPSAPTLQTMAHSFDVCAPYQGMRQSWQETNDRPR